MADRIPVPREAIDAFIASKGGPDAVRVPGAEWKPPPTVQDAEAMRRKLDAMADAGELYNSGKSIGDHWRTEIKAHFARARAKAQKRRSESGRDRCEAMINAGLTVEDMARELNIQPKSVRERLRRYGLTPVEAPKPKPAALTAEEKATVRRMIRAGATLVAMAAALGFTRHQMRARLAKMGIRGQSGARRKHKRADLIRLHRDGHTHAEIGRRLGLSRSAVAKAVAQLGLSRNGARHD